jgi:hypothetical protein
MKAFYIGPIQTIPNFNQFNSEDVYSATIPYDQTKTQYTSVELSPIATNITPSSDTPTPYVAPATNGDIPRYDPNNFWGFNITQQPNSSSPAVILNDYQVIQVCKSTGITKEIAYGLFGIAKFRESGFKTNAVNINSGGETIDNVFYPSWDIGIWQINTNKDGYGGHSREELTDPYINALAALDKYHGNGNTFAAWNTSPGHGGNYHDDDGSWQYRYYGGPSFYQESVALVDALWG